MRLYVLASLFLAAPAAVAQIPFSLQANQAASNFNWSGTSTLGAIVGNPSTAFQMAGNPAMKVTATPGTFTLTAGEFTGGDTFTVPDLHGKINNPIPFLPPLATIDVLGLHMAVTSPSFAVDGAGNFTASVTITALAGTLVVTPLGSAPTNTPLAGNSSAPANQNGILTFTGGHLHLNTPVNSTFAFSDPTSGASGTITVTGTLVADAATPMVSGCDPGVGGVQACPCVNPAVGSARGCDNSSATGGAQLLAAGVASLGADTLVFTTNGEKPTATSIVLQGNANAAAGSTFGQGVRCVSGTLKRLYTKTAVGGSISAPAGADPSVSARSSFLGDPIGAGSQRWYGVYYRDPTVLGGCPAASTFNVSQTGAVLWGS